MCPDSQVDLLLINPPWALPGTRGFLQNGLPALGILSIASYAEQQGFKVAVLDVHIERLDDRETQTRIAAMKPRVAGITVLTNTAIPAHRIARLCRAAAPGCTVVVGGVHAEALPQDMLRNSAIDAVVRGDGEEPMVEILQGKPLSEVRNVSYRDGRRLVHNPNRPIEKDLDKYPLPAYHLIDFKRYFPAVGTYRRLPAINMLMTRGCVGRCTFCNSAMTTLRTRSAASVAEQVKLLRERYGIRQVQFYDDTFTAMRKNVFEFCRLMAQQRVDVTWTAYIRADCFSDEMAAAMKQAGCYQVLMGIESADERIMKSICKPIDRQKYKEAVAAAHRHGLEVRGSFILGNIGETWDSMETSLRFAKEIDLDLMQMGILTPLPGTEVFRYAVQHNLLVHRNWNEYGAAIPLLNLPTISGADISRFERHAFRSFYLRPRTMLRMLRRIVSWRQIRDLVAAFFMFILGVAGRGNPKTDCWVGHAEPEFQDLELDAPPYPELTHEIRKCEAFTSPLPH